MKIDWGWDKSKRDFDRLIGKIPALDQAIRKKTPKALGEIGEVLSRRARSEAPKLTGALAAAVGYQVRGDSLAYGVWGVPYAYPTELGSKGNTAQPMIVSGFDRKQSVIFGEKVSPFTVSVSQFVRRTKLKRHQFIYPTYYSSIGAMFGILNRIIGECKEESGLGGN